MTDTKIVSQKIVFQSKYFFIKRVVFERDGKTFTREIEERNPVVLIVPYTQNHEIYLERQYRTTYQAELLELVAGQMNPDEDPLEAAKRELQEEAGIQAKQWKKVGVWKLAANVKQTINVFFATELTEGENKLDEDEQIEIMKMPLDEVLEKIATGDITVGSHIAALLLFDTLRKEGKL